MWYSCYVAVYSGRCKPHFNRFYLWKKITGHGVLGYETELVLEPYVSTNHFTNASIAHFYHYLY